MKKLYFATTVLMGLSIAGYSQQTMQLENVMYTVNGPVDEDMESDAHVRNISDLPQRYKVRSEMISAPEGALTYFCWTECYTPEITDAPEFIEVNPGEVITDFHGYYRANGNEGEGIVRFTFYNIMDATDTIQLNVHFIASAVSIENKQSQELSVYPNPAREVLMLQIPQGWSNTQLEIISANGSIIRSEVLTSNALPLQGIPGGLYLVRMNHKGESRSAKVLIQE